MEKKKTLRRPATTAVSAAAVAVPFVAEGQQQPAGQTVNQGLVPNGWLFDASGNLVRLSEEDLKQYELAQLVTAESIVQVDETDTQMIGISTSLLNQIGWYSIGAGAAAGVAAGTAAALGSGFRDSTESLTTTSNSSDGATPGPNTNSPGSVTIVDGLRENGDVEFEFIFEDPNGIDRAHLLERLENVFGSILGSTSIGGGSSGNLSGTPPPYPPPMPTAIITTSVNTADLIAGTTSSYSKISAEVVQYFDGAFTHSLFYKDDDGFAELMFLPISSTFSNTPATLAVIDDDIVANSTNQSVTYRLSDPDGVDRSYLVELLEWATTGGSDITSAFSLPATISTAVDPSDLIVGTTDVYSSIEFTLSGPTGDMSWYSAPGPDLQFYDYLLNSETFNLSLDVVI